jgi:hypothetical protein
MTLPINVCISTLTVHIIHPIQTHFAGIFSLCGLIARFRYNSS